MPLQVSFFKRSPQTPVAQSEIIIPLDVIFRVAEHVHFSYDLLNLSLTCKEVHQLLNPVYYRNLEIRTSSRCIAQLKFLIARPYITRHIRSLILRPNHAKYPSQKSKKIAEEELKVANALELLVPKLHSLEKFIWSGTENCAESIWRGLRICCPKLRYVGTNTGQQPLDPESELFKFDDLLGFSLTSKGRKRRSFGTLENLPQPMWDMLIQRCPNLQELVIGYRDYSSTEMMFNVLPVLNATYTWPDLHTLDLSNGRLYHPEIWLLSMNNEPQVQTELAFSFFLEQHSALENFNFMPFYCLGTNALYGRGRGDGSNDGFKWYQALYLHPNDRDELGRALVGACAWIGYYPRPLDYWATMREIDLSRLPVRPIDLPIFRYILKRQRYLKVFGIWVDLVLPTKGSALERVVKKEDYDFCEVLRSLLIAGAHVEHFKFRCPITKQSAPIFQELATTISDLGNNLRSFEVYKRIRLGDHLRRAAVDLAKTCPKLEKITLRTTAYPRSGYRTKVNVVQEGTYYVARDGNVPKRMYVNENPGCGYGFNRRYEIDLAESTQGWKSKVSKVLRHHIF